MRSQCTHSMSDYSGLLSHEEAERHEVTQLSTSGCGVTALLNVLITLGIVTSEQSKHLDWSKCILRTRANDSPLPDYLLSRSVAGCTGEDIVSSLASITESNKDILGEKVPVSGKFISFREIIGSNESLHVFIERNISEGKCLVATMNLQLLGNDAWHHQMIYGVDGQHVNAPSVYCVNPVCAYPISLLENLLSTDSVLLVRREDIVSRHARPNGNVSIFQHPDWQKLAVAYQIEAMIEENAAQTSSPEIEGKRQFVVIPANYVGGLAVFSKS